MPKKILELTFGYTIPAEELAKEFLKLAPTWAKIDGLVWKIWVHDGEEKTAGGRYLFDSEKSLQKYLDGELYGGLFKHPAVKDIRTEVYDILPEQTKITRGPV